MKTFKITLIMAVFASSLFLQSCETDPALDTIDGVEFASQTFQENAPCDNTSNPTCAFLLPMDYASAAPIIAERALRLCPIGFNCILTPDPRQDKLEFVLCPTNYINTNVDKPCTSAFAELRFTTPILDATKLNSLVCFLSDFIRSKMDNQRNVATNVLIYPRSETSTNPSYYYVIEVELEQVLTNPSGPCF